MRLFLLNQFVPPDKSPTARLVGDLAEAFSDVGWEPVFIGKQEGYRQGSKRGLSRLIRDLLAHVRLFWAGLGAGPCDWIVCLSDPPGLPFTAALLARIKGARLAHWAMDVYPEVAVQLGALPSGWASRWVEHPAATSSAANTLSTAAPCQCGRAPCRVRSSARFEKLLMKTPTCDTRRGH